MKNRKALLFGLFILLTSCSNNKNKAVVAYSEKGGITLVSLEEYKTLFMSEENIVSLITLKDENFCSTCAGGSITDISQYAYEQHFTIYKLEFDINEEENFITDYTSLVEFMSEKNDNGLDPLSFNEDGIATIPVMPRLILSNSGYIGFNVSTNFVAKLKETIVVKN